MCGQNCSPTTSGIPLTKLGIGKVGGQTGV